VQCSPKQINRTGRTKNAGHQTRDTSNLRTNSKAKSMLHFIWYLIVGLIAGYVGKSVMHVHMTLFWTIILGIVGSIVAGLIGHLLARPRPGAGFHQAG